jgi:hypothetical protein
MNWDHATTVFETFSPAIGTLYIVQSCGNVCEEEVVEIDVEVVSGWLVLIELPVR